VTGGGGPSGTGKKPASDPVLPAPVFIQESPNKSGSGKAAVVAGDSKDIALEESTLIKSDISLPNESSALQTTVSENEFGSDLLKQQESKVEIPEEIRLESSRNPGLIYSDTFNGLTLNAVFPVPVSSLKVSFWSIVLKDSQNNLSINPFAQILFPFSDLLNLTLPPVDALSPNVKTYYEDDKARANGLAEENKVPSNIWNRVPLPAENNNLLVDESRRLQFDSGKHEPLPPNNSFSALKQLFPGVNLAYGAQLQNNPRNVP
jgi:hypothetical protein